MKRKVWVEVSFCDICGREASGHYTCGNCGKEYCYACGKTELKEYRHVAHGQGTGDICYCHECDAKLLVNGSKEHAAYRKIESLRNEEKGWYEDFAKRYKEAELVLRLLQQGE